MFARFRKEQPSAKRMEGLLATEACAPAPVPPREIDSSAEEASPQGEPSDTALEGARAAAVDEFDSDREADDPQVDPASPRVADDAAIDRERDSECDWAGDVDPDDDRELEEEEGDGESPPADELPAGRIWPEVEPGIELPGGARKRRRGKTRLLVQPDEVARHLFTAPQRLLLLDTWQRSGLPAKDFADLVGLSKHTLYKWKQLFQERGPEGLMDQPRGARTGSRLSEVTRRTILMLKQAHPDWGCQRISDALVRGPALAASAAAVARVLREEGGYVVAAEPTQPHPTKAQRFERARPNELWQTDLFTFVLKRQNRRLYLVAFLDDHSRFVVSYGLHASSSTALVIEALEAGLAHYGVPQEILTDNGPQYVTWRGKSQFTKQLEKRGIRQIVAKPKRPQTLGKIERFWGTLWRELLSGAVFVDLAEARQRIGWFIDHYNFLRTHSGIDGLVPADRFFGVGSQLLRTLQARLAANSLELARHGQPKTPFYLTGQVSGQSFSVHAAGERLLLSRTGQPQQEIELAGPPPQADAEHAVAAVPLEPICPHGAPESWPGEPAEGVPRAPGEAVIDELGAALPKAETAGSSDDEESEVL